MQRSPKIVVEHLEPKLSDWLLFEYENAAKLGKNILFTNVKSGRAKFKRFSEVESRSVLEIFPQERLVILDPLAKKRLAHDDLAGGAIAVIGGILGDHPPRGRTRALLTSKAPKAKIRNLGRDQFPIDSAVYVVQTIMQEKELSTIPIKRGLILRVKLKPSGVYEVELPYVYPIVANKPLVSKKILKYLTGTQSPKIV